jgi:hypothetical protein
MPLAFSNPAGGVVAAGSVIITTSGKTTIINQNSDKAAIDWNSFNINSDEMTKFNQPDGATPDAHVPETSFLQASVPPAWTKRNNSRCF